MADIKIYIADETGNWVIFNNQFIQYQIDMRYDFIADAFSATLVDNDANIRPGYWMHFLVNDSVEFRGLIENVTKSVNKNQRSVTISGRSKTVLLVEQYFNGIAKDYNKETNPRAPYLIVGDLIGTTSFLVKSKSTQTLWVDPTTDWDEISDLNSAFNNDLAELLFDRAGSVTYSDEFKAAPNISVKVSPGSTVWNKIKQILDETGFEALYQDDVLYFGDLQKERRNYNDYLIVNQKNGRQDTLTSSFTDAITSRYSTINLFGQPEYIWNAADYYTNSATVTDSTLKHKKFFCAQSNGDLENKAIKLREDQRYAGIQLKYTVQDHIAPDSRIWKINRYCNVIDDYFNLDQLFVIYGRTFKFSIGSGTTTELTLSVERSKLKDI